MFYTSRYVHSIAPRDTDTGPDVTLDQRDMRDRRTLGAALRKAGILDKGNSLSDFRQEPSGRIVAFPRTRYGGMWHAFILTPSE